MKLPANLQKIANDLNKEHGDGTLIMGSDISHDLLPRTTTGSLALDSALNGGWIANQWNELYGMESSGKTAVAFRTVAANQKLSKDFTTVWIGAEEFVPDYAKMLGCDVSRMIVLNDNGMETAFQFMIEVAKTKDIDLIVLDSLPALVPEREDEKDVGEMNPGLGALLTGQFFRKQRSALKRSMIEEERSCTGLIINQYRYKIGVMYGDPRTTPGGKAKDFSYFTRVSLARDEWIQESDDRVGMIIKARVEKNKGGQPWKLATMDFHFADHGPFVAGQFDNLKEIVALGILYEVIGRKGAGYYTYKGDQWKGRNALIEELRADLTLQEQISQEVLSVVTHGRVEPPKPKRRIRR